MSLADGSKLTHYEILGSLGVGGMGEVYRARDTRLEREVAIKVLPEHFADDEDRLRRFEREAKTLASLNHPNIAAIFGIDQTDDVCFLALELVPGPELAEVLEHGPLPVDEALDVCRQIAEALEVAHDAGVVHRDLKPANVKLTPQDVVKVLDFGLAKPLFESTSGSSMRAKPDSFVVTDEGTLLGTPTYMSPEQARGKLVDRRTDIWAFGCVLYECLTGKRAFDGETMADVLGGILGNQVDFLALPKSTPASVRELLYRCLEKDPRRRLRDIGEARLVLEDPGGPAGAESPATGRPSRLPWILTAALGVILAVNLSQGTATGVDAPAEPAHLSLRLLPGQYLPIQMGQEEQHLLAISPDGSRFAFVSMDGLVRRLAVRELASEVTRVLPDTETATSPFFSPGGEWVGFFAGGKLKKVPFAGGEVVELADCGLERGGCWGPDGTIVYTPDTASGLMRISGEGGQPRAFTELDPERKERTHRWPSFLPGGEEVLFTVGTTDSPGDYEGSPIDAVNLRTGARRRLLVGASYARAAGEHLLFGRGGRVHAMRLAEADGSIPENPTVLVSGVSSLPTSGVVFFDVATSGTLLYAQQDPHANEFELAWIHRDGSVETLPFPLLEYRVPRLSPDDRQIAVEIGPGGGRGSDIFVGDPTTGALRKLTFNGFGSSPVWTPDGRRIAFSYAGVVDGGRVVHLGWKSADGSDETENLLEFEDSRPREALSFTPDSRLLLFQGDGGPGHSNDIHYLELETRETRPVATEAIVEYAGALSPDGRWVLYGSDASGVAEVYVRSFPDLQGLWQISDVGNTASWSPDGNEILYIRSRAVMSVAVETEPGFRYSAPRELFQVPFVASTGVTANYDIAQDGRLLVVRSTSVESMEKHLNVVLNAFAGLEGPAR